MKQLSDFGAGVVLRVMFLLVASAVMAYSIFQNIKQEQENG